MVISTSVSLPSKPSELIRLALDDLAACELDPKYGVSMSDWHRSEWLAGIQTCKVCMAGAVMAKTLKAPWAEVLTPTSYTNQDTINKLNAINQFRCGDIDTGFAYMQIERENTVPRYMKVTSYYDGSEQFRIDVGNIATMLEKHGH